MHRDPKKSHRDTYQPPQNLPDIAFEDNRPIQGMEEDIYQEGKLPEDGDDPFNKSQKQQENLLSTAEQLKLQQQKQNKESRTPHESIESKHSASTNKSQVRFEKKVSLRDKQIQKQESL